MNLAPAMLATANTAGGFLLPLLLMLPVVGLVVSALVGGRTPARVAMSIAPVGVALSLAIAAAVLRSGDALVYNVGGWSPPLGIALRADGMSAAMLVTTAVIIGAIGLFAWPDFAAAHGVPEARRPYAFWSLLQGLWAALNAVFLGNDLFSLYVALELLTFAAVPLVCLDGRTETIAAAMRYLLFALVGSVLYLLGAALTYGAFGTLDLTLLAGRLGDAPAGLAAVTVMSVGLFAKAALFPLYLWLPPAHAGAPSAASAVLSALVVKASFFLVLRLWFDAAPRLLEGPAAQLLGALGAGAVIVGSVLALRQSRLKMLIAYSTVAQIGYLFLVFPLASGSNSSANGAAATSMVLTGGMLQAISHAFAKAAMFLAAGLMAQAVGDDRMDRLGRLGRTLPLTASAFLIAGLSLMGVPPSGGFWAKWLLLSASIESGRWWWAMVIIAGGLLAGGYVFRVVAPALSRAGEADTPRAPVSRVREVIVLGLAICSLMLGLMALAPPELVQIGRPGATTGGAP